MRESCLSLSLSEPQLRVVLFGCQLFVHVLFLAFYLSGFSLGLFGCVVTQQNTVEDHTPKMSGPMKALAKLKGE